MRLQCVTTWSLCACVCIRSMEYGFCSARVPEIVISDYSRSDNVFSSDAKDNGRDLGFPVGVRILQKFVFIKTKKNEKKIQINFTGLVREGYLKKA